jgi:hypothetical protein
MKTSTSTVTRLNQPRPRLNKHSGAQFSPETALFRIQKSAPNPNSHIQTARDVAGSSSSAPSPLARCFKSLTRTALSPHVCSAIAPRPSQASRLPRNVGLRSCAPRNLQLPLPLLTSLPLQLHPGGGGGLLVSVGVDFTLARSVWSFWRGPIVERRSVLVSVES